MEIFSMQELSFGRNREEVTRGVRKCRNEKEKFCFAPRVVRVMGSRRIGERKNVTDRRKSIQNFVQET